MDRSTPVSHDDPGRPLMAATSPVERSRLGVYAAMGAGVAVLPLPWVPDSLVRRVRGALVHDVAVRHGLSLTPEAREVLAEPAGPDGPRGIVAQALRFFGVKIAARTLSRLGPVGLYWPVRDALRTYALGHLFDRYLELSRVERAVRIDVGEARRVRQAVDGALARSLTVDPGTPHEPTVIDDQRDGTTVLVDGVLGMAAGVPSRLMRRLDAAFDELLAHAHG